MYTIRVTGAGWWEKRIYYMSHGGLEREGALPALKKLNKAFVDTLTFLFEPGQGGRTGDKNSGKAILYRHGYRGHYLRGLHSLVTPGVLKIVESNPKGGKEIREGGRISSYYGIYDWAKEKLKLDWYDAEDMADAMENRGVVGEGNSPMRSEYPNGVGVFRFPEWIVKVKNQKDIDQCSRVMETMIVRYLR